MKAPDGTFVKDHIFKEFELLGYTVRCFEINAKNYGVPQHRERALFIAVRSNLNLTPLVPERTHGDSTALFDRVPPCRTFADACSDLPYLESGDGCDDPLHHAVRHPKHVIDWLWDVPEGQSAHENADCNKRPPSGYNTTYKRQVWNEPASSARSSSSAGGARKTNAAAAKICGCLARMSWI